MGAFVDKLLAVSRRNRSLLCVGLDPDPSLMPIEDVFCFNRAIIDATADLVCAYKPNFAFYEALGLPGLEALKKTIDYIPREIAVIGDAKRNDIGNTARAYAKALFGTFALDAATVNPYLGQDSLQPFLNYSDKGILILCKTSNSGSADFQELLVQSGEAKARPLYEVVAERAMAWNERGNVGLVVGATYATELKRVRALCPDMPILLPGVGAQQGDLKAAIINGVDSHGEKAIINSSRQVIYASRGPDFAQAARKAAQSLRDEINSYRSGQ